MFEEAPERDVVLAHVYWLNLDPFQLPLLPISQGEYGCSLLAIEIVGGPLEDAKACAKASAIFCKPDCASGNSKVPHGLH